MISSGRSEKVTGMPEYVAAVDQGTTSTRCMIFDHDGAEVARHQLEHEQILPRAGWVEHDPVEIVDRGRRSVDGLRVLGWPQPKRGGLDGQCAEVLEALHELLGLLRRSRDDNAAAEEGPLVEPA